MNLPHFTNFHTRGSGRTVAEGSIIAQHALAHPDKKFLYVLPTRDMAINVQTAQGHGLFGSNISVTWLEKVTSLPNRFYGQEFAEVYFDHAVVERLLVAHASLNSDLVDLREVLAHREKSIKALIAELQATLEARDQAEKNAKDLSFFYDDLREKFRVVLGSEKPQSENPKPALETKSCHGGQTGKFCSECGVKL